MVDVSTFDCGWLILFYLIPKSFLEVYMAFLRRIEVLFYVFSINKNLWWVFLLLIAVWKFYLKLIFGGVHGLFDAPGGAILCFFLIFEKAACMHGKPDPQAAAARSQNHVNQVKERRKKS